MFFWVYILLVAKYVDGVLKTIEMFHHFCFTPYLLVGNITIFTSESTSSQVLHK